MCKKFTSLVLVVLMLVPAAASAKENPDRMNFFRTSDMQSSSIVSGAGLRTRSTENAIIDNNVLSILVRMPYVYFGTHVGVSRMDLTDLKFVNYSLDKFNMASAMGAGNFENAPVFVGRAGGFASIRGESIINLPGTAYENMIVYSSYADKDGSVWFATSRNLHLFDKEGKWRSFSQENGLLPVSDFNAFFIDSSGARWIGSNALYSHEDSPYMNKDNWLVYLPEDNTSFFVSSIVEDSDNYLWFGTNRGVFRKKVGRGTAFEHIASEDRLPSSEVTSLAIGSDGTVWIGTKKGLVSYRGGVFFTYTTQNGLIGDYVNTVVSDGDNIWIGTKHGAAKLKDGKWITISRTGVVDRDFTLTDEQATIKAQLERQQKAEQDRIARNEQAKIWEARKGMFEDLKTEDSWAADFVFDLMDRGVFIRNDKFYPTRNVTREELVKMAVIAAGNTLDNVDSRVAPFLDVPENHWAVPYINIALREGVIDRTKMFNMGTSVTRLEAVQMLLKAFDIRLIEKDVSEFEDVSGGDARFTDTAAAKGIVSGYETPISAYIPAGDLYNLPRFTTTGSSGEDVRSLQRILQALGFYPEGREITGFYDGVTTDAVADYQVSRGILPKYTAGKFTEGLGSAGTATRQRLAREMMPTGRTEGVKKVFDPSGHLTRAQMAKIIYHLIRIKQAEMGQSIQQEPMSE